MEGLLSWWKLGGFHILQKTEIVLYICIIEAIRYISKVDQIIAVLKHEDLAE